MKRVIEYYIPQIGDEKIIYKSLCEIIVEDTSATAIIKKEKYLINEKSFIEKVKNDYKHLVDEIKKRASNFIRRGKSFRIIEDVDILLLETNEKVCLEKSEGFSIWMLNNYNI